MAPDGMQRRRSTQVLLVKSTRGENRNPKSSFYWDSSLGFALCVLRFFGAPAAEDLEL